MCGVCHPQFDCAADPGFAFIPTDLDYFIDFELQNRQRRNDAALEGVDLKREVPAPEMYKKHQIVTGEVAADAIGGRYHPVFLKRYMHRRLPFDLTTYFTVPKEGHGAPLACIRRCLPLLGSPRLRDIPTRRKLERLLSLYFFAEDENPPAALLEGGVGQVGPEKTGRTKRHVELEGLDETQPTKKKKQAGNKEEQHRTPSQSQTTFCPILQREVRAYWSLGPDMTSEDAVCQLAPRA